MPLRPGNRRGKSPGIRLRSMPTFFSKTKLVTCICGCGESLICRAPEEDCHPYVNISVCSANFYTYQKRDKLHMTIKALRNKPLTDIICTKEDVLNLTKWLYEAYESLQKDEPSDDRDGNISINDWWDNKQFALEIYSRLSVKDLLKGKIYRAFDLYYNKTEILALAQKLEYQMNEAIKREKENKEPAKTTTETQTSKTEQDDNNV